MDILVHKEKTGLLLLNGRPGERKQRDMIRKK